MLFLIFLNLRKGSLRPGVLTPELISRQVERMKELRSSGVIIDAWKKNDMKGAIELFEAPMEEDCRAAIATMPFRRAGILVIEAIMPVEPYSEAFPYRCHKEDSSEEDPELTNLSEPNSWSDSSRSEVSPAVSIPPTQFFALLRLQAKPVQPEILTAELVKLEIERIQELLCSGVLRGAWKRINMVAIAVLFGPSSEAECRTVIDSLPFNQAGILEIEGVMPVKPYREIYLDQSQEMTGPAKMSCKEPARIDETRLANREEPQLKRA